MESKIAKFTIHTAVVAVLVWIITSYMERGELSTEAAARANRRIKHQPRSNSTVNYAAPVVAAPKAEGAPYFQPPVQPLTRY